MRISHVKQALLLLCALIFSACDSSTPVVGVNEPSAANPINHYAGNSQIGVTAPETSLIKGKVNLFNTAVSNNGIEVSIRGSSVISPALPNGEFALEIPQVETEQSITLDIYGSSVMSKSISVQVPANADVVSIEVAVAALSPAITFNLDTGGVVRNVQSASQASVSVPANAFQFEDGSNATGSAEVSITEIDITELDGDSAWAPNLIGLAEGMTVPTGLVSFGMSDFHFSQDGRPLQLRQGVNATIKMDLMTPFLTIEGSVESINATEGAVIPLWHYDTHDMIWKEEGYATVVADSESLTGLSASGEVSHFSTWNLDIWTPSMVACIVIELIDSKGQRRDDLDVVSYMTTASIPLGDGPSWHMDATSWSNKAHMSPHSNKITVLANTENRQSQINRYSSITGYTAMDITVDNIVVRGYGRIDTLPVKTKKIFHDYDGDDTVVIQVVVKDKGDANGVGGVENTDIINSIEIVEPSEEIELAIVQPVPNVLANVVVVIVDFFGDPRSDLTVGSYRVTAESDATQWANQQSLTPQSTQITVQANDEERVETGELINTKFTLNSLSVEELGEIDMLFTVIKSDIFTIFDNNKTIVLEVAIADE